MGWMDDETGLDKTEANHLPLTPLSHLRRARTVFADRDALIDRERHWTYREFHADCTRLASGLTDLGVDPGDVVATLMPNIAAHAIATFGVPAAGAVINTINIRLDAGTVAYILDHGQAKVLIADSVFLDLAEKACATMQGKAPRIIEVADPNPGHRPSGRHTTWEDLLDGGDPQADWVMPQDEWESIALNYTSGTTGRPKGVVYHHRGAYLCTLATPISWRMTMYSRLLTIVPLFHCNCWTHTWMMPALGGPVICCRDITARNIYDAIADKGATHFGGAPIILNSLINAKDDERRDLPGTVEVFVAAAPPPPSTLRAIEEIGFNVTHVYGLTESYGPATECTWNPDWDGLDRDGRTDRKSRQGVPMPMNEEIMVLAEDGTPVPWDGTTQGEIGMRGNGLMKGYYRSPDETAKAFRNGWYMTGDLAVQHPDGYIKIADRAKDIIISGGENISSIEVEGCVAGHPAVSLCAVVAKPDDKWGEVPCAFVELKDGKDATAEEIISYVRERLAGFKTPKEVIFEELPKTSTGKVQKYELRKRFG
ncbi:AMP-binding protein [Palleronia rufa]|uniref:AMP-binding protein n=1 Tax=Palleronia rufa TaxID=1530186 RepID=UPI00056B142D|nr:AMP-binding protein [Palleronia rufa]